MPVSLTPSRMTAKISPSLDPCAHVSSARFAGLGLSVAPAFPSPWAVSPWQDAQLEAKSFLPAAIDVASASTVFVGAGFACIDAANTKEPPHKTSEAIKRTWRTGKSFRRGSVRELVTVATV